MPFLWRTIQFWPHWITPYRTLKFPETLWERVLNNIGEIVLSLGPERDQLDRKDTFGSQRYSTVFSCPSRHQINLVSLHSRAVIQPGRLVSGTCQEAYTNQDSHH